MKIQPLNNNLLVQVEEPAQETTTSGIILTEKKVRTTERATVLVGSEQIPQGSVVYFKTYAYDPVDLEDFGMQGSLGFVKEEHILGKDESST